MSNILNMLNMLNMLNISDVTHGLSNTPTGSIFIFSRQEAYAQGRLSYVLDPNTIALSDCIARCVQTKLLFPLSFINISVITIIVA